MAIQLQSTAEARRRLGVSNTTLYALLRTGELRSVKIGQRRLIPADAIDDYVERLLGETTHVGGDAA